MADGNPMLFINISSYRLKMLLYDLDEPEGYDRVWILGDNFVHESTGYLKKLFRLEKPSVVAAAATLASYIGQRYFAEIYSNMANISYLRSTLGRIHNLIATALNKTFWF